MAQISPARKAAFEILLAVERGHAHSDDLLRAPSVSALSPVDRNLVTALVLGVLRWQIALDRALRPRLKRPNARLDPEVLIALRLGAFQLLHMDRIPPRAAIDESVELAKLAGHRFASGMVNALLRKLAREPASASSAAPETEAFPKWMLDRWTILFGEDTTLAICRHAQSQPGLAIRISDPQAETELAQAGVALAPGALLAAARLVVSGDVASTQAFHEGRLRIQDEGSQLVAEIAGKGTAILDCCAAPGGKTMILAERNPQARIVACEASPDRLASLRKRVEPFGQRIACRLADASALPDESHYDLILADVPCSGTGTLGRNPEIRHRLRADDLARHSARQRAILASALRAARRGGRIVYSTCSLEPEENEQVVAAVLVATPNARLLSLEGPIDELLGKGILTPNGAERLRGSLTPEGFLRLLPGKFHTDGFFIALIERQA